MKDHLNAVVKLGNDLPSFLSNLTSTFKLALGIYSDKVATPFFKMTEDILKNPCKEMDVDDGQCGPSFNFQHSLDFTNDISKFIEKVCVGPKIMNSIFSFV